MTYLMWYMVAHEVRVGSALFVLVVIMKAPPLSIVRLFWTPHRQLQHLLCDEPQGSFVHDIINSNVRPRRGGIKYGRMCYEEIGKEVAINEDIVKGRSKRVRMVAWKQYF